MPDTYRDVTFVWLTHFYFMFIYHVDDTSNEGILISQRLCFFYKNITTVQ